MSVHQQSLEHQLHHTVALSSQQIFIRSDKEKCTSDLRKLTKIHNINSELSDTDHLLEILKNGEQDAPLHGNPQIS